MTYEACKLHSVIKSFSCLLYFRITESILIILQILPLPKQKDGLSCLGYRSIEAWNLLFPFYGELCIFSNCCVCSVEEGEETTVPPSLLVWDLYQVEHMGMCLVDTILLLFWTLLAEITSPHFQQNCL